MKAILHPPSWGGGNKFQEFRYAQPHFNSKASVKAGAFLKSGSPSNWVKGKSVSPDLVSKQGKSFPLHENHPSLVSSQSHRLSVAWLSHPAFSPYLAPPRIPPCHKTGSSRYPEGLRPPACLAAAVVAT